MAGWLACIRRREFRRARQLTAVTIVTLLGSYLLDHVLLSELGLSAPAARPLGPHPSAGGSPLAPGSHGALAPVPSTVADDVGRVEMAPPSRAPPAPVLSPAPAAAATTSAPTREQAPPAPPSHAAAVPPSPSSSLTPAASASALPPPPASPSRSSAPAPPTGSGSPSAAAPTPPSSGTHPPGASLSSPVAPNLAPYSRLERPEDRARAASLRTDPVARQQFWFDCLDSALRDSCRPPAAASPAAGGGGVISLDDWAAHVDALLNATVRFRRVPVGVYAGYSGPWIENHFISHFLGAQEGAHSSRIHSEAEAVAATRAAHALPPVTVSSLGSMSPRPPGDIRAFYPLVPLFLQWNDGAFGPDRSTMEQARDFYRGRAGGLMRPDLIYVALSQHDRGEPASGITCNHYSNTLVLSGGGWGNAAIPLIKGAVAEPFSDSPPVPRTLVAAFVGTVHLGREAIGAAFASPACPLPRRLYSSLSTPDWRGATAPAVFVLAPRGYGRSSFRLYEMLQAGRVPIYLYDDVPWLPYQHTFDGTGGDEGEGSSAIPVSHRRGAGALDATRFGAFLPRTAEEGRGWGDASDFSPLSQQEAAAATAGGLSGAPGGRFTGPLAGVDSRVLNAGGMWGPGGVGFSLRYSQIPAFACVACEFLLPGSAARWRHVHSVRWEDYAGGAGPAGGNASASCPCSPDRWEAVYSSLSHGGGGMVLPPDSLVAEMERRVKALVPSHFTYGATLAQVEAFLASPLEAELVCVPKPDAYGTPASDPPGIARRRRRRLGWRGMGDGDVSADGTGR